jgi:hypothetical protein
MLSKEKQSKKSNRQNKTRDYSYISIPTPFLFPYCFPCPEDMDTVQKSWRRAVLALISPPCEGVRPAPAEHNGN